jgi:prophage DNA circulation protein
MVKVKKEEVPLEKRVYENLRKHIDNRYALMKKEFGAMLGELKEELESIIDETDGNVEDLLHDVDGLEKKTTSLESILHGIKSTTQDLHNNKFASFPPKGNDYTPQQRYTLNRIKAASDAGKTKFLADSVVAEEYFQQPKRHMHHWDSTEDERLERALMNLVDSASRAHLRKKSAIMFRIAKLLKDAGVEL